MAGDAIFGIVKSASGARWIPAKSALSASQIDRYAAALVETIDDLPLPKVGRNFCSMLKKLDALQWFC